MVLCQGSRFFRVEGSGIHCSFRDKGKEGNGEREDFLKKGVRMLVRALGRKQAVDVLSGTRAEENGQEVLRRPGLSGGGRGMAGSP